MSFTFDQNYSHDGDRTDLCLDLKTEGDVRVVLSDAPGHATLHLEASDDVDFGPVHALFKDGLLTVTVPPLLAPDAPGRAFAFSAGPISFSLGSNITIDAVVTLPAGSDVSVRTRSGDIQVLETAGPVNLKTGSGDVLVDDCSDARVSTGAGDLRLSSRTGGVLNTGSGDVFVDPCPGELQVHTGSGDVSVGTSSHEARLTVATGSGDIMARLAGGTFDARTGSGDILVSVVEGLPVWLDLTAPMGDITQALDSHGAPGEGEHFASITARTGTGDINVNQYTPSDDEVVSA